MGTSDRGISLKYRTVSLLGKFNYELFLFIWCLSPWNESYTYQIPNKNYAHRLHQFPFFLFVFVRFSERCFWSKYQTRSTSSSTARECIILCRLSTFSICICIRYESITITAYIKVFYLYICICHKVHHSHSVYQLFVFVQLLVRLSFLESQIKSICIVFVLYCTFICICATSGETFLSREPDKRWAIDTQQHISDVVEESDNLICIHISFFVFHHSWFWYSSTVLDAH